MNFDNGIMSMLLSVYSPDEIAKYIRLSLEDRDKEDKDKDESESITNQRRNLNQFKDIIVHGIVRDSQGRKMSKTLGNGIADNAISIVKDGIELYMPFEGLVDIEEERKRLEAEKKKIEAEVDRASKMLANPGFVNNAPKAKIEEEQEKLEKYKEMLKLVVERLK